MWRPANVEAGLQGLSLLHLGAAFIGVSLRGPVAVLHVAQMAVLALLASLLDRANSSWFAGHPLYSFRASPQAGLAQGLLALPSLATAAAVATRSWWWRQLARSLLASSCQQLLWIALSALMGGSSSGSSSISDQLADAGGAGSGAGRGADSQEQAAKARGARSQGRPASAAAASTARRSHLFPQAPPVADVAFLAAAGACALAAAAGALYAPGVELPAAHSTSSTRAAGTGGAAALLPGSVFASPADITASSRVLQLVLLLATVPCQHLLALTLPRCFTPGESGIILQALLALAACSNTYTALAVGRSGPRHLLWFLSGVHPDPSLHVPAYVALVLFWVLALAACCAVARGPGPQKGTGSSGGQEADGGILINGPQGHRTAAASTAGAANGVAPNGLRRRATAGSRGSDAAGAGPPAAPGGAAADAVRVVPGRHGGWGPAVRGVAAAGAGVSFLMLVDLALWVLGRFVAASSQPRLATLAYWFGCLVLAVPVMYVMSKASAAREKGRRAAAEGGGAGGEGSQGAQAPGGAQRANGRAASHVGNGHAGGGAAACNGDHRSSGQGAAGPGPVDPQQQQQLKQQAPRGRLQQLGALLLHALAVPHIVMRKGYHLLAIVLFLPAFGWDVRMLQASLGVAAAVLVFVEVLRCCGPAAVRAAIGGFMSDFADARDSGPVYITHFTLLLGIALPVWLADPVCGAAAGAMMGGYYGPEAAVPLPAAATATGGGGDAAGGAASAAAAAAAPVLSAAAARLLPSCQTVVGLCGLVSLGSGDTAAAVIGFLLGRLRLFRGGKKTWEGTLSGALAMMLSWVVCVWWMDVRWALGWGKWAGLVAVTGGVALLEAVTLQLDNVVVPLYYCTHLVLLLTSG